MLESKSELLKTVQEEFDRERPIQDLKKIKEFWPFFVEQMASMLEAGPGPRSTLSQVQFEDKTRELAKAYESLYREVIAGRSDI
jgi:hypothetical protein